MKVGVIEASTINFSSPLTNPLEHNKAPPVEDETINHNTNNNSKLTENQKTIEDIKLYAKIAESSMEQYRNYLLLETKCRKIYGNLMRGKLVGSRDEHFLLKNKPELYAIAKILGKKNDDPRKSEKVLKSYEKIKSYDEIADISDNSLKILV